MDPGTKPKDPGTKPSLTLVQEFNEKIELLKPFFQCGASFALEEWYDLGQIEKHARHIKMRGTLHNLKMLHACACYSCLLPHPMTN